MLENNFINTLQCVIARNKNLREGINIKVVYLININVNNDLRKWKNKVEKHHLNRDGDYVTHLQRFLI